MTDRRPAPGTTAAINRLRRGTVDAVLVLAEIDRLRARNADLEETVRILRVQLPLMEHAIGPNPDGPDPRWARIPQQRVSDDAAEQGAAEPTRSPGR